MLTRRSGPTVREAGPLHGAGAARWRASSPRVVDSYRLTRLFALAFMANAFDLLLSWMAILRYGLTAEANPIPLVAWGWSHGLVGAMAVKAALLAVVVATAAMQPRHATALLCLVGFAGILGAASALIVL